MRETHKSLHPLFWLDSLSRVGVKPKIIIGKIPQEGVFLIPWIFLVLRQALRKEMA